MNFTFPTVCPVNVGEFIDNDAVHNLQLLRFSCKKIKTTTKCQSFRVLMISF